MKYIFALILSTMMFPFFSEAQDWPNLAKYKDANAKLSNPSANENRVVFMGNSITEGWVRMDSAFFAQHSYLGRGISGQTTPQMLIRFKQDVVNLKPKVVVILAGTNDIAGNTGPSTLEMIEDNLSSMAELAKAANIEVILSSVLPVFDYPWRRGLDPSQKIITLNKWIKDYAIQHDCFYLDYFSSLVDDRNGMKPEYSPDGVHPNLAGYKVMEPLAEQVIKLALQKSNSMSGSLSPLMDHTTVFVVNLDKSTNFYKECNATSTDT